MQQAKQDAGGGYLQFSSLAHRLLVSQAAGLNCCPLPDGGAKEPRTRLGPVVGAGSCTLTRPCAEDTAELLTMTMEITATIY